MMGDKKITIPFRILGGLLFVLFLAKGFFKAPMLQTVGIFWSPVGGLAFAIIGGLFPSIFGMGCSKQNTADLLTKLFVVVFACVIIKSFCLFSQTAVTVIFATILITSIGIYLGELFGLWLVSKFGK